MTEYNHLLYAKLPKWVREDIESLTRHITKLERGREILLHKHPKSDTAIRFDYPNQFYVPNGTRVEFTIPGLVVEVRTDMEGRLRVQFEDGVILPSGRNCIHIVQNKNPKGY